MPGSNVGGPTVQPAGRASWTVSQADSRCVRRASGGVDRRTKGHSYPQAWYEAAIGAVLERIARVDDYVITEVVRLHAEYEPRADELGLARLD
jgi:hypothetical protein